MTENAFKKLLKQDKKVDWELFISRHQEYSTGFSYLIFASMTPQKWFEETTGLPFALKYSKRVGDNYYWSISESKAMKNILYKKGTRNPLFYIKLIKNAEVYCDTLIDWCDMIRKQDFSQRSNTELLKLYTMYWENLRCTAALMWVKHNLNRVLEKNIREKLKKIPEFALHEEKIFNKILIPNKDTLITQANKNLAELAEKKTLKNQEKTAWLEKYSWIETFTWVGKELSNKSFSGKLIHVKKDKQLQKSDDDFGKLQFILLENFSLFTDIQALKYLLYFHTYELECLFAAHYKSKNLLKEIATRINLSFEEMPYAIYPEICSALEGKTLSRQQILSRKNNQVALYRFDQKITLLDERNFKKIKHTDNQPQKLTSLIKGNPAFLGKTKGRVIIVKTKKDFGKFNNGEILVAPMTTIDFTPYLKNVKAIVTDEGGITCHAAIVARELQIPCVIGTKIATQVLKDGDQVEVDAYKGVVKFLK